MFGHQDDQNHHHHDDDQHLENVLSEPAADAVLSDDQAAPSDFNPALPTSDADQAAAAPPQDDTATAAAPSEPVAPVTAHGDLLSIKQQALNDLSPLVDHLDQSPEEKFRTTMMMIQASDNHDLIKNAYEAAQAIPDEKVKAQALLDIVNEINYFTQQNS